MSRIAIFGKMTTKPGQFDAFMGHFVEHARASRAEPGGIRFDVAIDPKTPDTLRFYEIWADKAALDVHAKTERILAFRDATKDMLADREVVICELKDSPDA